MEFPWSKLELTIVIVAMFLFAPFIAIGLVKYAEFCLNLIGS